MMKKNVLARTVCVTKQKELEMIEASTPERVGEEIAANVFRISPKKAFNGRLFRFEIEWDSEKYKVE